MKKISIILVLILNVIVLSAQDWWDLSKEYSIPTGLDKDTLFVERFKKGDVFTTDKKVANANKKLEKLFDRLYPYEYAFFDSIMPARKTHSNIFSYSEYDRTFTYTSRSYGGYGGGYTSMTSHSGTKTYTTNRYRFFNTDTAKSFDNIKIYSEFKYKTLRMLLKGIRSDIAGINECNIVKVDVFDVLFKNKKYIGMSYERAFNKVLSLELNWYSGQHYDEEDYTQFFNRYYRIEPTIKTYFSFGVDYAKGLYLSFGPLYNRVEKINDSYDTNKGSYDWYTIWGLAPSFGIQHSILNKAIISYNIKLPFSLTNTQELGGFNLFYDNFYSTVNVQIGYKF